MNRNEISKYYDFLLSLAMEKCADLADAQDLAQETVLAALVYLQKGEIDHPKAWLTSVLERKFYDLLRRKYQLPTVTVEEGFDREDGCDVEEELIRKEEAERVRRELAYLADGYRKALVYYYFRGMSVRAIAERLNLTEAAVKSRLNFGRNQMKKGLTEMENYSESSYMPKRLGISFNGRSGLHGEPLGIVDGDVLGQNLLILAYERPLTLTQLSKSIGVAAAYVEPIVNRLVDSQLMVRMGDGKVYTDFILYDRDDWIKYVKDGEDFAEKYGECYIDPLRRAVEELKSTDFYSLPLERFMTVKIAQDGLNDSMKDVYVYDAVKRPDRPDGGNWFAMGNIRAEDCERENVYRGREDYGMGGLRTAGIESYLDGKNLTVLNFETALDPNSNRKFSGYGYNGAFFELERDILRLAYLIEHGIDPASVDLNLNMINAIPTLIERGYLKATDEGPKLQIPHLTHAMEREFTAICRRASDAFAAAIREPMIAYCAAHKKRLPPHLKSVPEWMQTMPYEPQTMMFVYEAIRQGLHPRDLGYPCPETVVIFD